MKKTVLLISFATLILLSLISFQLLTLRQTSAAAPASTLYPVVAALLIDDIDPSNGISETASFQLVSFSWGESNEGPTIGTDTEQKMLTVTKEIDEYSADLFQSCADQRVWSTLVLNVSAGEGNQKSEILNLELYNVEVRGYDIQQPNSYDSPVELLTLYFDSIEYTTIWYNPSGTMAGEDTETWDFGLGTPIP